MHEHGNSIAIHKVDPFHEIVYYKQEMLLQTVFSTEIECFCISNTVSVVL